MDTGASLSCHVSNLTLYMLQMCTVDYENAGALMINGSVSMPFMQFFVHLKASHVVACHGFWKAGRDVFSKGNGRFVCLKLRMRGVIKITGISYRTRHHDGWNLLLHGVCLEMSMKILCSSRFYMSE